MDEADLKVETLSWVRRASKGRTLPIVTSEFSLNGTGIRADIAIMADEFIGVEIKSAADTLRRLSSQLKGYERYFDRTMVILAENHFKNLDLDTLREAQVWAMTKSGQFERQIPGSANAVEDKHLLNLLTQDECRRASRSLRAEEDGGENSLPDYRKAFRAAFRARYQDTSSLFWTAVQGRRIRRDDLNLLSRFYPERARAREEKEARASQWSQWFAAISTALAPYPIQSSSVS
jgi:hypothetical protein